MDVWSIEDNLIVMPSTGFTPKSLSCSSVLHRNAQRFNLLVLAIVQRALMEVSFKSMMY